MANAAAASSKDAKAAPTTSPVGQILEKLGISRDELRSHTEQMRDFLQKTSNGASATASATTPADNNPNATTTPTRPVNAPFVFHDSSSPFAITPTRPGGPVPVSSPYPSSSPSAEERPLPYTLPPPPYSTAKPNFSYAALIGQALLSSPKHRLTLNDIYRWVSTVYPYFSKSSGGGSMGWQNSIRHNLSLNPCFVKLDKNGTEVERSMKGSLWAIPDEYIHCFADGGFKKPQGLPYLGGKQRKSSSGATNVLASTSGTHQGASKKQKLSHTVASSVALQALASQFPWTRLGLAVPPPSVYPPTCPSAASSSASSPPPSIAASQTSSASSADVPELTNSSSSPPDDEEIQSENDDESSALQPAFGMDDDVFLSEPIIRHTERAKLHKTSPLPTKDLLSRVIEARQFRSTTTTSVATTHHSNLPFLSAPDQPIKDKVHSTPDIAPSRSVVDSDDDECVDGEERQNYPQSHLRTPTRGSSSRKDAERSRVSMDEIVERTSRSATKQKVSKRPVTPPSFTQTIPAINVASSSTSRLSPDKTPLSHKGLTMSPRHPALLDSVQSQLVAKGKKRVLEREDEDSGSRIVPLLYPVTLESSPSCARKERKERASRKLMAELNEQYDETSPDTEGEDEVEVEDTSQVTPKQKSPSSLLHPSHALSQTPRNNAGESDSQTKVRANPRRLIFGPSPHLPAMPSLSTIISSHQPQKAKLKPPFSPSLFKTPAATRNIHLLQPYPLYDPYDSPARREDEIHRLLGYEGITGIGESDYGSSPGSFFGQRQGVLYESPVQRLRPRGGQLKRSALLEDEEQMEQ